MKAMVISIKVAHIRLPETAQSHGAPESRQALPPDCSQGVPIADCGSGSSREALSSLARSAPQHSFQMPTEDAHWDTDSWGSILFAPVQTTFISIFPWIFKVPLYVRSQTRESCGKMRTDRKVFLVGYNVILCCLVKKKKKVLACLQRKLGRVLNGPPCT